MAEEDNTVANLQGHIRDLEKEIIDTKRMVNRLLIRKGQPSLYPDAAMDGEAGSVFALRTDQFYGESLSGAMRQYLKLRRTANVGPGSVNDIYEALCRGGFNFGTDDEDNRKRILRLSLVKNTSLFHRLPNGHYGLSEWYGEITKKEEEAAIPKGKRAKKHKHAKKASKVEKTEQDEKPESKGRASKVEDESGSNGHPPESSPKAEEPNRSPPSMVNAVQEALMGMKGEFTKQDVVNWIEQHYPLLKAQQRKSSVFSMMANLKGKLKLVTVRAGKGTEPHTYRKGETEEKANGAVK